MRRVFAIVACVVAAPLWADEPAWRPPAPPAPLPVPTKPPPPPTRSGWSPAPADRPIWTAAAQTPTPKVEPQLPDVVVPPLPKPSKQEPAPPPRTPMPPPAQPKPLPTQQPAPLPTLTAPRTTMPAPQVTLGPAQACPPASQYAVPVRHGTFGSPNITLSRDYHFLDLFGAGLFSDDDTVVLGEGVATDRFFAQAEYLLWWMRVGDIPALTTTAPPGGFGFLGQPGTQTLLGPGEFGTEQRHGFRIRGGTWFENGRGVDGSFFFLGRRRDNFAVGSQQTPTIARPFFAPNFNQEFSELVASPGLSTGALQVEQTSLLWGADVNLRTCVCRTCESHSEWFTGYRHLNLQEDLRMTEFITAGPTAPDPAGTRIVVSDSFRVRNQFHGGQLGYAVGRRRGRLDFDVRASVALGVSHQELDIDGFQQRTRPGQALETFNGGLLAAGPNLGRFTKNKFGVVPEATVNVGYAVTPNLRVHVGYNFLYWSNVIRPGEQIDRVVNLNFVPNFPTNAPSNVIRPLPTFTQSNLWAHGLQFGVEWKW